MSSRLDELKAQLARCNASYHDDGESELTDDEYDALKTYVESATGLKVADRHLGSGRWPTERHATEMMGIPHAPKTEKEFLALADKNGFVSLKYDGMALEIKYEDGKLVSAVLQGDGVVGEVITENVKRMAGVPHVVTEKKAFSVFGEIVVSYNNLKEVNRLREIDRLKPYANPRSAAAGARGANTHRAILALMAFRAIDVFPRIIDPNIGTKWLMAIANGPDQRRRFMPVDYAEIPATAAWRRLSAVAEARMDNAFEYMLDGIVYHGESAVIKLKFPAESAITKVTKIKERVGRTGVIAPVCEFAPVVIGGTVVARASVHNATLVSERLAGLGPGAEVLVSKRGDVIPHVESVVSRSDTPWSPTEECPSCGTAVVQDGSIRRCSNDPGECPGTAMGLLLKFCRELAIDGVGPGVLTALIAARVVETPAHLFTASDEMIAAAMMADGHPVGPVIARKIRASIDGRSTMTWGTLLSSVGVRNCARAVMESVAGRFPDLTSLYSATHGELASIPGIGPERASSIRSFIDTRWAVIEDLAEVVNITGSNPDGPLKGSTFCITLGLRSGSRPEVEARIIAFGGAVKSSVTKQVTHLVCNFPNDSTEKLAKARELGIPIISEDDLFAMMGAETKEVDVVVDPSAEF